jgi:hypothetical protein
MDYQIAQARLLSKSKNWEAYEPEKLTAYPAFSLRPSVALRLDASLRLSTTALVGEVNLRVSARSNPHQIHMYIYKLLYLDCLWQHWLHFAAISRVRQPQKQRRSGT